MGIDVFGRQATEVRQMFGDLPIIEARADVILLVTAAEHETGHRGDPNACMFSEACKRSLGAKGVLFYPTVAYIDLLDPKDRTRRVVMRFGLPAATRRALEEFDQGVDGAWEATFLLKAIPAGQTLKAKAKRDREYQRVKRGRALSAQERSERKSAAARKGHETRRAKSLLGIRDGTGQVRTNGV